MHQSCGSTLFQILLSVLIVPVRFFMLVIVSLLFILFLFFFYFLLCCFPSRINSFCRRIEEFLGQSYFCSSFHGSNFHGYCKLWFLNRHKEYDVGDASKLPI